MQRRNSRLELPVFRRDKGGRYRRHLPLNWRNWMRFVQKRLALNKHSTYMAKNLLYAAVASLEGMKFNWVEYVASRMHNELSAKRVLGKVPALLCSNYVSEAIKYQLKQPICKEKEVSKEVERPVETVNHVTLVPEVVVEDPNQSKGKEKMLDPILKGVPSKNKGLHFEDQTSSERTVKEVILAQLSQLQLTVEKLVDVETIGSELEVMKRAVVDKQRGIDIVRKQIEGWEEKCKNLKGDITRMDKAWRADRLQAQANEIVTKKEKAALQKELEDLLEKRSYQESEAQKLVRGLEEQLLQSRNQADEAKAKVAELKAELAKANHLVSISNFDSEMDELKKSLDDQQKLHKAKDEKIAKLENEVRLLDADNEELTPQLNQNQYYDASEEDDEIEEVQAPNVVPSESI